MKCTQMIFAISLLIGAGSAQASSVIDERLEFYRQGGAEAGNVANAEALWRFKQGDRSCTSCHGETPYATGRHAKTGKPIEAMAPSINRQRFTSARKIEKWFKRNCKWTLGRECSAQEKTDLLSWLGQL